MATEIYQQVPTKKIEGFVHSAIQGVNLPPSTGLTPEALEDLMLIGITALSDGTPRQDILQLSQISPKHGRSYEVLLYDNALWKDEYGNTFQSLTLKGNNLTNPHVFEQDTAPSGFAIYGLQESDCLVRIITVSDLLRSHGIDTEMIVAAIEPKTLPIDGQVVPLEEFKRKLIKKVWDANHADSETGPTRETIPDITHALDEKTFFITARAMQCPERLDDLEMCETLEDHKKMLARIFTFINSAEKERQKADPTYTPKFFDPESNDDYVEYLSSYLPRQLGKNFAKLHGLGLVHEFPHAGNISAAGGIYDLDSVKGKATNCGDEEVTAKDIMDDIDYLLFKNGVKGVIDRLNLRLYFPRINLGDFYANFFDEYIDQWDKSLPIPLTIGSHLLGQGHTIFSEQLLPFTIGKCTNVATQETGIDYRRTMTLGELFETIFAKSPLEYWKDFLEIEMGKTTAAAEFQKKYGDIPQLAESIKDIFRNDIQTKNSQKLAGLPENYSEEERQGIIELFALREYHRVLSEEFESDGTYNLTAEFCRFLLEKCGYEENIIKNFPKISAFFDEFAMPQEDKPRLDYYANLLSKHLGWDFEYPETVEEIIAAFQENEVAVARELIEKELAKGKPDDLEKLMRDALYNNPDFDGFNDDPNEKFMDFISERAHDELIRLRGRQIQNLYRRYGKAIGRAISNLFVTRAFSQILSRMTDVDDENVFEYTEYLLEQLRDEFREQFGIPKVIPESISAVAATA